MTSIAQKLAVATAFSVFGLIALYSNEARAATVTYDFTAVITRDVTNGSLLGKKFKGFFSYDDSALTKVGQESLGGAAGKSNKVKVSFSFLGATYTEAFQKGDYPVVDIKFVNGRVESFKYFFWDKKGKAWFLLGGNSKTSVALGPGVGQVSYTLRLSGLERSIVFSLDPTDTLDAPNCLLTELFFL